MVFIERDNHILAAAFGMEQGKIGLMKQFGGRYIGIDCAAANGTRNLDQPAINWKRLAKLLKQAVAPFLRCFADLAALEHDSKFITADPADMSLILTKIAQAESN